MSFEFWLLISPPKTIVASLPAITFVCIDFSVNEGIPSTVFVQSICVDFVVISKLT